MGVVINKIIIRDANETFRLTKKANNLFKEAKEKIDNNTFRYLLSKHNEFIKKYDSLYYLSPLEHTIFLNLYDVVKSHSKVNCEFSHILIRAGINTTYDLKCATISYIKKITKNNSNNSSLFLEFALSF